MGRREVVFIVVEAYCLLTSQGVCLLLWNGGGGGVFFFLTGLSF